MTVTVQQIVYARDEPRWYALAAVLGLVAPFPPEAGWAEFDGGGVLAIHAETPEYADGTTDLHLLVDDLDTAQRALAGRDAQRTHLDGVGDILVVRAASGVTISASAGARATSGDVSVQPIWFQDHIAEARGILEAFGLQADLAADRGGWVELQAEGGGAVGVHSASGRDTGSGAGIGLSFLARGDLDAFAERLSDAGFSASVVDEAYARTIRIDDPEVWINGVQDDLYGYHRAD
ncbi:hypothetical protein [Microbacterium sp. H1-D42]|uniref:hypothetical protein n=1 Tax=Microbacterium sp. H1-D42 TaxID=2925844 RepID=UPI001F539CDE|nr:hypothetical protein [Microbacterium sp. H1-D42]UNK72203.1 hypothetical protein MNR00_07110 [Microbacterium sp. H1-D42]